MPTFPGGMFYRAVACIQPGLCSKFIFIAGHSGDARVTDIIQSRSTVRPVAPSVNHGVVAKEDNHKGESFMGNQVTNSFGLFPEKLRSCK
jgi:hypothetical protein